MDKFTYLNIKKLKKIGIGIKGNQMPHGNCELESNILFLVFCWTVRCKVKIGQKKKSVVEKFNIECCGKKSKKTIYLARLESSYIFLSNSI